LALSHTGLYQALKGTAINLETVLKIFKSLQVPFLQSSLGSKGKARTGGITQVVESLPRKYRAPSSNLSTTTKERKKKERKEAADNEVHCTDVGCGSLKLGNIDNPFGFWIGSEIPVPLSCMWLKVQTTLK
jgi:hypothetical protein